MFAAFLGLALYGSVFVLPVFLQAAARVHRVADGHGDPAGRARVRVHDGRSSAATPRRLDARVTVPIGALLFLLRMWQLSRITLRRGSTTISSGR